VTPADAQIVWTEYLRHRARVRGFDLAVIEHIVRFASERYFDVDTRRMVAIGRHRRSLVLIPYDEDEQTMTPVTIHATTRQQLIFRLQQGRLLP
jgi:RNA:NAD 2'-phosphotransferase (TPT1/KptA family)